ncbi:hypothetical protein VNI00_012152 [Paramarasmius palmivorus]|uniref:F-box domain-containing protein n=1 Tax=Paramarasmius palmivorus TaxID=297713 RepID=A0AAW0C7W8_9AGAR
MKRKQKKAVSDLSSVENERRSPCLPPEILKVIFEDFLIYPDFLIDMHHAAWRPPSHRENAKMKTSIIAVCRDWYHAGIHLLYKEASLWHLAELGMLTRTLRESPRPLRRIVTGLYIACVVPCVDELDMMLFHTLYSIIRLCPNLRRLSFVPNPDQEEVVKLPALVDILTQPGQMDQKISTSLTDLRLGGHCFQEWGFEPFIPLLSPTVETLTLNNVGMDVHTPPAPPLTWPKLEWLRCFTNDFREGISPVQCSMVWAMPSLKRLSHISPIPVTPSPLLDKCGAGLEYLNIYSDAHSLQAYLDKTPKLKHLVLQRHYEGFQGFISHPTLQSLMFGRSNR